MKKLIILFSFLAILFYMPNSYSADLEKSSNIRNLNISINGIDLYWNWANRSFDIEIDEQDLEIIDSPEKKYKEEYNNLLYKYKHRIKKDNIDDLWLNHYKLYLLEEKIDTLVNKYEGKLYNNWESLIEKIDYTLENKKLGKYNIYALNYLRNEINLNKEYVLDLLDIDKNPKTYSSPSLRYSDNFEYSKSYTTNELTDGSLVYWFWIWAGQWKYILNISDNLQLILLDNFSNSDSDAYIQFNKNWVLSNKVNVTWFYEDFTYTYLRIYPNGNIVYYSSTLHEGISLPYMYLEEKNIIIDLYEDYMKDLTYNFEYFSWNENEFTIFEKNTYPSYLVTENGSEYLTFDINSKEIVHRESILKLEDDIDEIKKSDYLIKEVNKDDFKSPSISGDEYWFYLFLQDKVEWFDSRKFRIINNDIINDFINKQKYREYSVSFNEITFKLYDKKSKEIDWNYKKYQLDDWTADYVEIPYIEVLDIK